MRHGLHRPRPLELGATEYEELEQLGPVSVGAGYVFSMAFSVVGGKVETAMSVLDGPRRELRRVVFGGAAHGCQLEGDVLRAGRRARASRGERRLPAPVAAATIVCVHLNYRSRAIEFGRTSKRATRPTS